MYHGALFGIDKRALSPGQSLSSMTTHVRFVAASSKPCAGPAGYRHDKCRSCHTWLKLCDLTNLGLRLYYVAEPTVGQFQPTILMLISSDVFLRMLFQRKKCEVITLCHLSPTPKFHDDHMQKTNSTTKKKTETVLLKFSPRAYGGLIHIWNCGSKRRMGCEATVCH